jgi:hypothetical protein
MSEPCLKLVIDAVRTMVPRKEHKGRGRKPYDPVFLTALTYFMVRNGMSLREMEKWCMENMELLRTLGYEREYPPSWMTLKRTLDTMTARDIQKITAKIKYLRGEIRILWF